jgi:DNA-directed RNA polymerase subunit RPC12/RpoP
MKCNTCKIEFEDLTGRPPIFGVGSAMLYLKDDDYYILAYFGSKYDMQRFALKKDKYETGIVCDDCISKFIKDGKAWMIEDGVW